MAGLAGADAPGARAGDGVDERVGAKGKGYEESRDEDEDFAGEDDEGSDCFLAGGDAGRCSDAESTSEGSGASAVRCPNSDRVDTADDDLETAVAKAECSLCLAGEPDLDLRGEEDEDVVDWDGAEEHACEGTTNAGTEGFAAYKAARLEGETGGWLLRLTDRFPKKAELGSRLLTGENPSRFLDLRATGDAET